MSLPTGINMPIVAGVLLALYLMGIVYAVLAPSRSHDPQRGQAVGCLMIVAAGIALLGVALGIGVAFELEWLVSAIVWIATFPVILLAVSAARYLLAKLTPRRD